MKRLGILLTVLLLAPSAAHAQSAPPYEAVFSDGTRVEGDRLTGWHEPGAVPHLQGVPLRDAKRQLLWFRNRRIKPYNPSSNRLGSIEFAGGDRFIGRVVGLAPSSQSGDLHLPAHLLVAPPRPPHVHGRQPAAYAHILPGRIQRVVWGGASQRRLQPGKLYYADGRQLGFLRLRWKQNSVLLLLKNGTREVELSKIAEVHLLKIDPWEAYYQELAILSPSCRSRLVRLETAGGLIATGSDLRFRATPYATPHQKQQVIALLKRLDDQIIRAKLAKEDDHKKLQQARAEYQRQLAEGETRKKAAKQISDKAAADMRQRIDNQRKADAARLAKQRQQFEQELRAAEQAMQQRLAAMPADKRDKELKAFRQRQAETRKSRAKSFEQERLKQEQQTKQRQKQLEQFIKSETQKLTKLGQDLARQVAPAAKKVTENTKRWEQHSKHLVLLRLQRASAAPRLQGHPGSWHHMVQPVWSLYPLWIPVSSIHTRLSFAPQQVPLCRVQPAATVSPALLPWRLNCNSDGGPLRSGGQEHGWGFGVHAYSELSFALPQCAKSFRSRIGLDRMVGGGGCVRARVYVGSVKTGPAYQGPLLVGSKKTVDTGWIQLRLPSKGPKHLILQADPAHDNRPRGADPLNIRDKLDWLDPQLALDTAKLQDQVRRVVGGLITASQGWTLKLDKRGVYTWTSHFDETGKPGAGRFLTMVRAQGQPLRLSREMTIGPTDKWLAVHLGLGTDKNPRPDAVTLHIGGRQIQPRKIPIRQLWQSRPAPIVFSLDEYKGRKITLELRQPAGGKPLYWQTVSTSAAGPSAYRLVDIMELVGKSDMQVPYELGQALQSNRIGKEEKLAALEVTQLGGVVNFRLSPTDAAASQPLANVLVGSAWTGGDKAFIKTFKTFRSMRSLKMLLVTKDSGVSDGTIAKLRAQMPKLTITRFIKRIPTAASGPSVLVTWRNLTANEVVILYIDPQSKLNFSSTRRLKPGQELKRSAFTGVRYETHYTRKDYANAKDYTLSLPLSSFLVARNAIWEIKPLGKGK